MKHLHLIKENLETPEKYLDVLTGLFIARNFIYC